MVAKLSLSSALETTDEADERHKDLPEHWSEWLPFMFGPHVSSGFADHHAEYWDWHWHIGRSSAPGPFLGVWSRGGGKSTAAELGAAAWGLRGRRNYVIYVRDTQDRADDSVTNIAMLLESDQVARHYEEHAQPMLGRYGQSRGWRRNRVRTSGGFTVDALGLDVAARGVKLEQHRPDGIIFDDIDGRHDSRAQTEKKMATITDSLLPAGTDNAAILGIQNLIVPNGIFSQLVDGRADFLGGRTISGPHPALRNLKIEKGYWADESVRHIIVEGEPSWSGQDREACQRLLDRIGLASFLRECQHSVKERLGALWTRDLLDRTRVARVPDGVSLTRVVIGVDPSGGRDEIGIIVVGRGSNGHSYVLDDYSALGALGPRHWGTQVVNAYHDWEADRVVAEANFGGDMVVSNIRTVDPGIHVEKVNASRGKAVRAEPVASLYEDERSHHVGAFNELETELTSWVPGDPDSPNRMDAMVWAQSELMLQPQFEVLMGRA